MSRHFHDELKELKEKLLLMGFRVENMISKAVDALLDRNLELAAQVFEEEKDINQLEIEIDDKGHALLALCQPMAVDLRLIAAILKINTDLERMGDHAVNIAERAISLIKETPFMVNVRLPEMAIATKKMLRDALDSFVDGNVDLAQNVLKRDDEVDNYNDNLYAQLEKLMEKNPVLVKSGMNIVMVGHNLERIADLANNIAEGAIYMKQGKEVRHHVDL